MMGLEAKEQASAFSLSSYDHLESYMAAWEFQDLLVDDDLAPIKAFDLVLQYPETPGLLAIHLELALVRLGFTKARNIHRLYDTWKEMKSLGYGPLRKMWLWATGERPTNMLVFLHGRLRNHQSSPLLLTFFTPPAPTQIQQRAA